MDVDLDKRTARMAVGDFAGFSTGPREGGDGAAGLWRAQLGTHWHRELRARASADHPGAEFERAVEGCVAHRGWKLTLNGRVDQVIPGAGRLVLREIKSVTRELPGEESALRAEYPGYFIQLAAYAALLRAAGPVAPEPELLFVEAGSGLLQRVALTAEDDALFHAQLCRVVEFLELRLRARDRLRNLDFTPPFASLRPGQGTIAAELEAATRARQAAILLEAPTGFGKTGVLLEFALGRMRAGDFERTIYVTGKSTGQIQVLQTLASMTRPGGGLAAWQVRPKAEHCVNHAFHCVRDGCAYLDGAASRWQRSGLSRFYLFEGQARDIGTLRAAGQEAGICPYEITRAALAFNDLWVGDYNYVFSPSSRSLFFDQPGFDPARTLLIVDEAHNLASRVADAFSHSFSAGDAIIARQALDAARISAHFAMAWDEWARFLGALEPSGALDPGTEEEARRHLGRLAGLLAGTPVDHASLGAPISDALWRIAAFGDRADGDELPSLWWCPRPGELAITCLDAADSIGAALGEFGGVVLATATPGPVGAFAEALGLRRPPAEVTAPAAVIGGDRLGALTKRETRKLSPHITSGTALLKAAEARAETPLCHVRASTPWRQGAYDVACDLRVDTSYRERHNHYAGTAATVEALSRAKAGTAVFFSSYAYADAIIRELAISHPRFRASLQPRMSGLAEQAAWISDSLASADALFLVLGSGFAESIDLLGGRITRAMVVGPALPEVNAVQRARLGMRPGDGHEAAFRRVYQIPGMQKVNQALGRLVRAPGQHAKVLLHCRRFAEPSYAELLAQDFRSSQSIATDTHLEAWLADAIP